MNEVNTSDELKKQNVKLLYRASFGPLPGEIDTLNQIGMNAWFETQFSSQPSYHLPKAQQSSDITGEVINDDMRVGVWWQRAIQANDQLRQRMAYALSQIFVVSSHGVGRKYPELTNYYDILVKHAFGNFRDLLEEVTLSPIMGKYLSLEGSKKANPEKNTFPDENYAREVMQLFTLGLWKLKRNGSPRVNPQGKKIPVYSQFDVEELARVLTGWRRSDYFAPMHSDSSRHDSDEKYVLGETFPPGQSAEEDLKQALDLLFEQDNTPPFIANLLIKRFVTSNPRKQYVRRVAEVFINNGQGVRGDLKATIYAVLTDSDALNGYAHPAGLGRTVTFGLVKEPILAIANQARAFNMKPVGKVWLDFPRAAWYLGQSPLNAPSVFNFYPSDFSPQGEFADIGLTAPEFYLLTTDTMRTIHNRLWGNVVASSNTKDRHWTWDISEFVALHLIPTEYVALVNERLFGGLMSEQLAGYLYDMLENQIPAEQGYQRVRNPLYVAVTSPEFFCQEA